MPRAGEQPLLVGGSGAALPGLRAVHGFYVAATVPASAPVLPAPGQAGARGRLVLPKPAREILADVVQEIPDGEEGDAVVTGTARARIIVPSPDLIVAFSLGYELVTPGTISSYTSSAWSATLMRPAPAGGGGRECELHSIFASATLPQGYAVTGLVGEIAISAALAIPIVAGTGAPGQWVLQAEFKPGVTMCPEDAEALLAACTIRPVKRLRFDIAEA